VFSGPLFYIGLLMALDPAGIPILSQWLVHSFRRFTQRLSGRHSEIVEPRYTEISHRARRILRLTGVGLLVFAIVV
jgi:hypothetical protein